MIYFFFFAENGGEAALLDLHGHYVLLDGGDRPIDMLKLFKNPECAVLSTVSAKTLPNAVALNQDGVSTFSLIVSFLFFR